MTNASPVKAGVRLSAPILRTIFPKADLTILYAFLERQHVLSAAGVNQTRQRLAYFFANIHHETGGLTIANLTESINYSAERMAAVWPNRFANAAAVRANYGTAPGWQLKAFDDIYGGRMGNRPGTSDGSTYIGRGGPQITGRDGYAEIGKRIGHDLMSAPALATYHHLQPDICAAFWDWKGMNKLADPGNFTGCVKAWNGGTNGLADRQKQLARIQPLLAQAEWGPIAVPDPPPEPAPVIEASPPSIWAAFFMVLKNLFGDKS